MFGELIGLWCADAWQSAGAPAPVALVELGPGRGTLDDAALQRLEGLEALERPGPAALAGLRSEVRELLLDFLSASLAPPPAPASFAQHTQSSAA